MDWIHCNSCFLQPGETKGMQYLLTSCGHIYCGNCLNPGSTDRCKICKEACTTIPLTSEMTPDVQEFFTGVDERLNKLLDILAFQNGHRLRLVAYNRAMGKKYKNLKEENRKLKEIIQALQRKTKELEKELQSVKRKLSRPPSVNESGHSSNFFLTPSTPASIKSLNNSPRLPGLSPESSLSPSPQHSRASSSKPWITPNRLTHSPFSTASPGGWSPDNEKSHVGRRTSVPSNHHGRNISTPPYRTVPSHYSSQSNTPRTPSDCGAPLTPRTPRTPNVSDPFSLPPPTSASVSRVLPHYSSQSNTSRTPSDSGVPHTPGSPQTPDLSDASPPALPISASMNRMISQMSHMTSTTSTFGLLSLNSQRSSRDIKYT